MRKLALLLALVLIPAQAWALNVNDLLSTIAMPLAVAAVSNAAGGSDSQLADLVTSLNQANVPPQQFIEVIRYVPVTLYDQNGQPFVAYVQQQTQQGVTGDALVNAIVSRLQSNYNVTPTMTLDTSEPTTYVLSDNYIPSNVTTLGGNPLSLIALPLAVAAVSDISGIPQDQLGNLVATLNNANVPIAQEVQIIRYAPVALVTDNGQPFVQFVQQQTSQGITGPALVPVVVQQLQTYYPAQTQIVVAAPPAPAVTSTPVVAPSRVVVQREVEYTPPPVVVSRMQEMHHGNPHGGPPGQLKKQFGYETGAQVVHQQPPVAVAPAPQPMVVEHGRGHGHGHEKGQPMMISSAPPPQRVPVAPPVVVAPPPQPQAVPPGLAKGHGAEGHGAEGHGPQGHGKGHGKD